MAHSRSRGPQASPHPRKVASRRKCRFEGVLSIALRCLSAASCTGEARAEAEGAAECHSSQTSALVGGSCPCHCRLGGGGVGGCYAAVCGHGAAASGLGPAVHEIQPHPRPSWSALRSERRRAQVATLGAYQPADRCMTGKYPEMRLPPPMSKTHATRVWMRIWPQGLAKRQAHVRRRRPYPDTSCMGSAGWVNL